MYDKKTLEKLGEKTCCFFQIGKFSIQTEEPEQPELITNKRFIFMSIVGISFIVLMRGLLA
jgi:hypothetical protein